MKRIVSALLLACFIVPAHAVIDTYDFSNEEGRRRFNTLTQELRCPKCQNQDLADSNSPIAADLRQQIYLQLEQGKSNDDIIEFMVARYGEFVRYKPEVNRQTWLLWYGPGLLLLIGLTAVSVIVLRRRRSSAATSDSLSTEEQSRLDQLLKNDP